MNQVRILLLAALGLSLIGFAPAAGAQPKADVRFAATHGRKIAYMMMGQGGPPIVFLSGFGDGIENSRPVATLLARQSTVLVFDRAGYGDSDPSGAKRTGEEISAELEAVLDAADVTTPVILIGHSSGGLYAEYFAQHHPERVAGLILDDGRPIDFLRLCLTNVPRDVCTLPPDVQRTLPAALRLELTSLDKVAADIGAHKRYSGPVMILARGGATGDGATFDEDWTQAQAETAARLGAVVLTSPGAGHYIHRDTPAWFQEKVSSFVERIRATRRSSAAR